MKYDSGEESNFDDERGFSDYIPHTIDPSPWAFVACVSFCLLLVFLLPFGVALIQLQRRRSTKKKVLDAGFIMNKTTGTDGTGKYGELPLKKSSTTIEMVLDSNLAVQPLDLAEEELVRSSTNISLKSDEKVLALCRPDLNDASDPLTRYLITADQQETDIDKKFLPLEKSSTFVKYGKGKSSSTVQLTWKPSPVEEETARDSSKTVAKTRKDSRTKKAITPKNNSTQSESHSESSVIYLGQKPEDINTDNAEKFLYALVQSSTGDIKIRNFESTQNPLQHSTTLNPKSHLVDFQQNGGAEKNVLERSETSTKSHPGRLTPKNFLHSASKRWRNREKQESLLAQEQQMSSTTDPSLLQSQPLDRISSLVEYEHMLEEKGEMLPGQRSFYKDIPYYLCAHIPSICTCDGDMSIDSAAKVDDCYEITIKDSEQIRKKSKHISVYSDFAKRAYRSVLSSSQQERRQRRREKRKLRRDKTKRQVAIEKLLRKIYADEDSKTKKSKSIPNSKKSNLFVNVIPTSSRPPKYSIGHSPKQEDRGPFQNDDESDDSSTTSSVMTDVTLADLNVYDFSLSEVLEETFLQYDDTDTSLLDGWEKRYDQQTQTIYYYNSGTGERSTQCPIDPVLSKHEIALDLSRKRPWVCYFCSSGFFRKIFKLLSFDDEMKEILKLAAPYTSITVVSSIFSLLEVGVIGRLLGTNDLSAYFAVQYIIELATIFLYGIMQALHVTCCQAIGAENWKLAGQYVQLSVWIHQIYFIPLMILFWNRFDEIVLRLGFDEEIAESAQLYANYAMLYQAISVYHYAILQLLDVTDRENYSAIINSLQSALSFVGVLIFVNIHDGAQLWMLGLVRILIMVGFFLMNTIIVIWKGWLEGFWSGLVGSNPMSMSWDNLKAFLSQALPLSIGYVIEYGEWEVLFIFAAIIGPAEMAVWGLLGEIWGLAEGIAGSATDASEVRVAMILGSGQPKLAKYSAEKSLCIGVILSWIMAVLLLSMRSLIPKWLTKDETLQSMLTELLPLVCLGVIILSVGNTSWSILCAQGRSHLATAVTIVGSVFISLPFAFLSTFGLNLNLEGLVASLVIGYSVSGFFNTLFLMSSNWERISRKMSKGTKKKEKVVDVEMTTILR
ncbi:MAG: Na+-driven multidrug efflux pump [Bacillariaceae sp.]|jgi:Na+-driven multidrug efflux pump